MTGPTDASQGMGYRQLKVEDALAYLDKVRRQDKPTANVHGRRKRRLRVIFMSSRIARSNLATSYGSKHPAFDIYYFTPFWLLQCIYFCVYTHSPDGHTTKCSPTTPLHMMTMMANAGQDAVRLQAAHLQQVPGDHEGIQGADVSGIGRWVFHSPYWREGSSYGSSTSRNIISTLLQLTLCSFISSTYSSPPILSPCFLTCDCCSIDTPGVIRRVSELFKGHNNLILGFNTFLPPGYKIELVPSSAVAAPAPAPAPPAGASSSTTTTSGGAAGATGGVTPTAGSGSGGFSGAGSGSGAAPRPPVRMPPPPVRTGPGAGPLEFDHAISYVTKIKRRFASDPSTYKAFLEILHTYQKQQRSIKDVLERVSVLFKDHADLLRDFTYFLPDAVQDAVSTIMMVVVTSFEACS